MVPRGPDGACWALDDSLCDRSGEGVRGAQPANDRILLAGDISGAEAHLRDFGFDPGPVDGVFTAQTRSAVRAYQARYGLPISGQLDRATRRALLLGLGQRGPAR